MKNTFKLITRCTPKCGNRTKNSYLGRKVGSIILALTFLFLGISYTGNGQNGYCEFDESLEYLMQDPLYIEQMGINENIMQEEMNNNP